jgi:hypothetical protein
MINVLIACLLAIVAYWIITPLAGLPVIVGAVAAILVLLAGIGTGGLGVRGGRPARF